MPKFVIERTIPAAGKLPAEELKAIAQKSCVMLEKMGPRIQWVESYVCDDKVYCVYIADNERMIQEHADRGEFPIDRVSVIKGMMDPTTAE